MAHPKRRVSKTRKNKEELITKLKVRLFQYVKKLERLMFTTEHTHTKEKFIIKVNYFQNNFFVTL